jgi:hypothetical protein
MPPILLMLPEACWLGVKPNDTASSLGLLNACPLSMAAKNAEALHTDTRYTEQYLTAFNFIDKLR